MKLRVYLDTSVFSAYCDARVPDRQAATEELWRRLPSFEAATSELARQELANVSQDSLRSRLQELLQNVTVFGITEDMNGLAREYVSAGILAPAMFSDALHVAAAVLTRQDVLLSWNFKHLVNRRRRAHVNQVNVALGLPLIEILSPQEI